MKKPIVTIAVIAASLGVTTVYGQTTEKAPAKSADTKETRIEMRAAPANDDDAVKEGEKVNAPQESDKRTNAREERVKGAPAKENQEIAPAKRKAAPKS